MVLCWGMGSDSVQTTDEGQFTSQKSEAGDRRSADKGQGTDRRSEIRSRRSEEQKNTIDVKVIEAERGKDFKLNEFDRFRYRTRYFIDSAVIGSREFVDRIYQQFRHYFSSKHEKHPKTIKGLDGIYSLKRLSER